MEQVAHSFIYTMILSVATLTFTAACQDTSTTIPGGDRNAGSTAEPEGLETTTFQVTDAVRFKMIAVEGGTFRMGLDASDVQSDQRPAHNVTLSDYLIGETEVTQTLWQAVMGSNPSEFRGNNLPVDNVTWEACKIFVTRLNKLLHENGQLAKERNFHLPTEAQWEYAARGGNRSKGYTYAGSNDIDAVAWTRGNTNRTHPVASKIANELGLYDMSGNVWEWVEDFYAPYPAVDQTNPVNTTDRSSGLVIKRGGSWYYSQEERFRPTFRYGYYTSVTDSSIGVRLCL